MNLSNFNTQPFIVALKTFFADLKVPVNYISDLPIKLQDILKEKHNADNATQKLISEVYALGVVDNAVFEGKQTTQNIDTLKNPQKDYQGLVILGVVLKQQPTRSQLSEITRLFNRAFPHLPVNVVFKYEHFISLANSERSTYKQEWREGEKVGKVSLLRDIDINKTHSGHLRILEQLKIERAGKNEIKTFEALYKYYQSVFSISTLNKEFYQKLFNWYLYAQTLAKFPQIRPEEDMISDSVHTSESLIRLLTRILFVWFMKEKGLINHDLFDKNELMKILKSFHLKNPTTDTEANNYYKAILQNLFFATLNKPIEERKMRTKTWSPGEYADPLLYRFQDCFTNEDNLLRHFENIPFLNGGLFDCLDSRKTDTQTEIRLDGFSSDPKKQANLPDKLFFGEYKDVDLSSAYEDGKKNKQTVFGLIDILHQYKFTIEENTPLEEEIALDPELLGKVFENLLASYNPETQSTARKQTGSFYTPREIVDYMVDESLKAYLSTNLDNGLFQTLSTVKTTDTEALPLSRSTTVDKVMLDQLFSYQHTGNPFNQHQSKALLTAINNCKILDPACGSGAFPMGVLQKMIFVLEKLDPQNQLWLDMVVANFPPAMQTQAKQKLQQENWNYVRKLGIIQECIYGIDIQPIATQITKLRFFISLLVDQIEKPNEENRGFSPLPNLDFKVVTANTLISVPQNDYAENLAKPALDNFENLTVKYFNAHTPADKKQLKAEIESCVNTIVEANQKAVNQFVKDIEKKKNSATPTQLKKLNENLAEFDSQLKLWKSYTHIFKHETVGFFEPKYFFPAAKDGFDVVIGNPPYVLLQSKTKDKTELNYFKSKFKTAVYKVDLYHLFIEKGLYTLKKDGVLTYINPSNFQTNNYTISLREMILSDYQIINISNFDDDVFDASVNTCVLIVKNNKNNNSAFPFSNVQIKNQELIFELISEQNQNEYLANESFIIQPVKNNFITNIIIKIENNGKSLKSEEIGGKVNFGMQLRDRAEYEMDVVESTDKKILSEFHEPCLTGKNIQRYSVKWSNLFCYFNVIAKRGGCWNREAHSTKNKLIIRQIGQTPIAAIDEDGYALLNSAFMITSNRTNTKYMLSLINSKLIEFYWLNKFSDKRKTFPKIKGTYLELIPIPNISSELQAPFITLVDKILEGKKAGQDTGAWEHEIDIRVYHLYELTYEEACIIDPSLSMEQFDKFV